MSIELQPDVSPLFTAGPRWVVPRPTTAEDLLLRHSGAVGARAPAFESLQAALHLEHHHLSVVNNYGEPVGVVCTCALRQTRPSTEVFECMNAPVVYVELGTPLEVAAELMRDGGMGCLPVTRQGVVVGMVTREDLLQLGVLTEADFPRCSVCGSCYHVPRDAPSATALCRRCREEGRPWELDTFYEDTGFGD